MRYRRSLLLLGAVAVAARLFQLQMARRVSSESLTTPSVTPLILPIVKRGLQEDYCHIYEGVFSTATKAFESTTELVGEHMNIVYDAVEDGYFWAASRLNHAMEMVWDVMIDIYLAPELEWCILWSALNRHLRQKNQEEGDEIPALLVTLDEKYEMNWNQIVCSAPLEYGLRTHDLQNDFRKLATSAVVKTRHTIKANQVDWLHTLRSIQQSVTDAHSNILSLDQHDPRKLTNTLRTSRRRLKRLITRHIGESNFRASRSFTRLNKAIHRMFHDTGMTPLADASPQVACLDELRQQIMGISYTQYLQGLEQISATGKNFGDAVMDTLETSLAAFTNHHHRSKDGEAPTDNNYYHFGVNGTDVMVTTVPMVVYSSMKRVDVDLAALAKAATDISDDMEQKMCGSWEAAARHMSRSEYTWRHWLTDWWNFLKFVLWVALKVVISFF
ncbi:hypothetical protein BJV82DRAFT_583476 [Fennellomyces sp. T-0311]|nr:hypothetical protein BJV82DRAFT_583476 [Fennellomyces sp. T-0311]